MCMLQSYSGWLLALTRLINKYFLCRHRGLLYQFKELDLDSRNVSTWEHLKKTTRRADIFYSSDLQKRCEVKNYLTAKKDG
jgi:hypothetical protein